MKKPDFEALYDLCEEIGNLSRDEMLLKADVDFTIATVAKEASSVEGKPPSMDYIKTSLVPLDSRVIEAKKKLAELTGKLKFKENLFKVMLSQIDVYRTETVNQRLMPT